MLQLSEVVRGGGTPLGSYFVDGEGPFDAAVTEGKMRAGAIQVCAADQDTVDTIASWHRQNGRDERAAMVESAWNDRHIGKAARERTEAVKFAQQPPATEPPILFAPLAKTTVEVPVADEHEHETTSDEPEHASRRRKR
jgi:hypothetical protein